MQRLDTVTLTPVQYVQFPWCCKAYNGKLMLRLYQRGWIWVKVSKILKTVDLASKFECAQLPCPYPSLSPKPPQDLEL